MEKKELNINNLPEDLKQKLEYLSSEKIIIERYIERGDWYSLNNYFKKIIKSENILLIMLVGVIIKNSKKEINIVCYVYTERMKKIINDYRSINNNNLEK